MIKLFSKKAEEAVVQKLKPKLLSLQELREECVADESARLEKVRRWKADLLTKIENYLQTDEFIDYINEKAKVAAQHNVSASLERAFPFNISNDKEVLNKTWELLNKAVHPDFEVVLSRFDSFIISVKATGYKSSLDCESECYHYIEFVEDVDNNRKGDLE